MKEHPILFSAPMVLAILGGHKTQTRRIVKPPSSKVTTPAPCWESDAFSDDGGTIFWPGPYLHVHYVYRGAPGEPDRDEGCRERVYPKWSVGDRLWVRESWWECSGDVFYMADSKDRPWERAEYQGGRPGWLPSIHMPHWASRLTLEVVSVRVERLLDISEEDAREEGVKDSSVGGDLNHRGEFHRLWDHINGERAPWASSPWVWVVEFKRVEP
jgi:hypothetical protein